MKNLVKFARLVSFVVALLVIVFSMFFIEPGQELARAQQAFRKGDMDQALRLARRANWAFSNSDKKVQAYFLQAKAASKMGWKLKSKSYINQLLLIDKSNAFALLFRAGLEYQLGRFENALGDFQKGLKMVPGNTKGSTLAYYHAQFGLTLLALNQINDAEKEAVYALGLSPGLPGAHDLLSQVLEQKGDIAKALAECEKAYQLFIDADNLWFMSPEGQQLSERLVALKVKFLQQK